MFGSSVVAPGVALAALQADKSPDLTYRNAGPWGEGKGAPLTAAEIDHNFHVLAQAHAAGMVSEKTVLALLK